MSLAGREYVAGAAGEGSAPRRSPVPAAFALAKDVFRYGFASIAALATDWGGLAALSRLGMDYRLAATISFLLGLVVVYALTVGVVFSGRRKASPRAEMLVFLGTGLAGLALNFALIYGFVEYAGLKPEWAKAPTVLFVFAFNFLSRRALLFSPEK